MLACISNACTELAVVISTCTVYYNILSGYLKLKLNIFWALVLKGCTTLQQGVSTSL